MQVLYSSLAYPPSLGGGEVHLHHLAKEVARRGHGVRVVSQWSTTRSDWTYGATVRCDVAEDYVVEGVPVHRLGFDAITRSRMHPWAFLYRNRVLRKLAIRSIARRMATAFAAAASGPTDLVHALRMGPPFLARAALAHSRRIGVPFVVTALHHPDFAGRKSEHYARIYRAADAVIALTRWERDSLVDTMGVAPSRVHVTGVGPVLSPEYSVEAFRERNGLPGPYVLYLGRKVRHKGFGTILGAAPEVLARFPDLSFVFIGEDDESSVSLFESFGDERIRNLGTVDLATKTAALADCELLCLPSTSESFGGVYTEAWAFGKPVIGGRIPPVAEVIEEGVDGLLASQDREDVAKCILLLLERPEEAERLGEAGRRKVKERYGWDALTDATLAIYESVREARALRAPDGAASSM